MTLSTITPWIGLVLAQPPNPPVTPPPGLEAITTTLLGWMKWLVVAAGVGGILYCAFLVIIGRRNRSATAYEGAEARSSPSCSQTSRSSCHRSRQRGDVKLIPGRRRIRARVVVKTCVKRPLPKIGKGRLRWWAILGSNQ